MLTIDDVDLQDKRVVIRVDFNVPYIDGKIADLTRITAVIPTIKQILKYTNKIILISHHGHESLEPVVEVLAGILKLPVLFAKNLDDLPAANIILCENTRFLAGEKTNDPVLAKKIANLGDVFVMDAFASCHRAHASTLGVAQYAKVKVAGPLLVKELASIDKILQNPQKPIVAIIAGSKVSTKLNLLKKILSIVDTLIVGGGIANTFILAQGNDIGASLCEPDFVSTAKELLQTGKIIVPEDVVVAKKLVADATTQLKAVNYIAATDIIGDIGPKTSFGYKHILHNAGTILWNGPMGVFEIEQFSEGTEAVALAVAKSPAYSVAGGGDTLAAIAKFDIRDDISYISTGGGAFLACLEGKTLPAIEVLNT